MSTKKTLYLHIGHYKTGSSAIQDYCSRNAEKLREDGFLYPETARPRHSPTNHGHLSLSVARDHGFTPPPWYGENVSADDAYAALMQEVEDAPETRVIVSSEEFVQLALRKDPAAALDDLAERLSPWDVRIVFYLREPMSLLKSWYNEVNKGPAGTRNFPTFSVGIHEHFLSQKMIWDRFATAFGAENMITLAYGDVGDDHIIGFFRAVGCSHQPDQPSELVQIAQPIQDIEKNRLKKAKNYQTASMTLIKDMNAFITRSKRISQRFNELTHKTNLPVRSQFTAAEVFAHYRQLLAPLLPDGSVNQKEVDNLRDMALAVASQDRELALQMLETAHLMRPGGPLIKARLDDLRATEDSHPPAI